MPSHAATGPGLRPDAASGAPQRRAETARERRVDAIVHGLGVALGLVACAALAILAAPAESTVRASVGAYGAGLLAMLVCSAIYNIGVDRARKRLWRRLDHAAIFVMIAGTYTPFAAVAIGGAWGTGLLVYVWTVAAAGAVLKLFYPGRLESLSIAAYLLLGWTVLPVIDHLIAAVSLPALVLLLGGGILYSVGVLFYRWERLPYHRAVWHGLVLLAATCQYFAILDVITR